MAIMADPEDKIDRGRLTPNSSDSIKLNAKVFIINLGPTPEHLGPGSDQQSNEHSIHLVVVPVDQI